MLTNIKRAMGALLVLGLAASVQADEAELGGDFIPLSLDKPYLHVVHDGRSVKVQRIQDADYELKGYFARTSRKCPPFCIQSIVPAPDVDVIGEVELFAFMETELRDDTGILIDARTASWFKKGTIPGSVNVPFTQLSKTIDDPEMLDALDAFGAQERGELGFFEKLMEDWGWSDSQYKTEKWDFSQAKNLVLWCNGPACGQSPRAIRGLLAVGYPGDKIKYYRGGMQMWQLWGLTTVVPR